MNKQKTSLLNFKSSVKCRALSVSVKARDAFTLLEIIIVLGIFTVIVGSGYAFGIQQYSAYILQSETNNIASILSTARSKAMNNINNSNHGVYFDTGSYIVFQGDNYESRDEDYDEKIPQSRNISVTSPEQIVFNKLRGNISIGEGTINISGGTGNRQIELNDEGRINY